MAVDGHEEVTDPTYVESGEYAIYYGRFIARPPGTPRALPLSPGHSITFIDHKPTVRPSIHYDPGGPWDWHGWLTNGAWVPDA